MLDRLVETRGLSRSEYAAYTVLCARLLVRAHSQSPGAAAVDGYLGGSGRFDRVMARWSMSYAGQTERDFAAPEAAAQSARVPAERGI